MPTEFTITVKTDGNGTASASHVKAVAGTEITLTATPNTGYHFEEWQVVSGGVTIKDDKFTMPSANVAVKAIFEKDASPAPTEYTITFDGNGGTPSVDSMTTTNRKLTSLPSASRSGSYSFDGWYTEKSGGTKITTDTVLHANITVYAHWTYIGGGGGSYNPPVTYYTLRFETGGGSDIPSVREAYNAYIDLTKYEMCIRDRYDTARRVALVKQRVRENNRRKRRRGIYGLSAACMLLFAVLMLSLIHI